jgi:hypothetical protein
MLWSPQHVSLADPRIHEPDEVEMLLLHHLCGERVIGLPALEELLQAHPDALKHTDWYGRLPLHILCMNKNCQPETLRLLISAYPAAIMTQSKDGHVVSFSFVFSQALISPCVVRASRSSTSKVSLEMNM